jgi:hypothetical protein
MPIISQADDARYAKFRENLRWSIEGVMFVTLHIVGSNDNLGRTQEMDAEHRERKAANIAWLRQAFNEAKGSNSRGLAVMTQANPNFSGHDCRRRADLVGSHDICRRARGKLVGEA